MPLYEYKCQKCENIIEKRHSIKTVLKECPECGSKKLDRIISGGSGVIYRGDGFYVNDYKRNREPGGKYEKQGP